MSINIDSAAAQAPSASEPITFPAARETPDDGDKKQSRKQHTREMFVWFDQVVRDPGLPPAAFKVAFVIGQRVNCQSGEAWPSTDSIAKDAALVQSTVRAMVDRLAERGHL